MTKYLGLLRLSAKEAERMISDGVTARREFVELIVRNIGGTVDGFWLTNVGDWDVACLVTMADRSPAAGAAATIARRASGYTTFERWIELAETDDVALALDEMSAAPT
ncbi:MAG: hypothetical protein AAFP84_17880 [Actinomycetota bacterium]